MTTERAVVGFVHTHSEADRAIAALVHAGFPTNEISAVVPHPSGEADGPPLGSTKAPEGAVAGVGAGGVLGGALGLLIGIGALAIPGLGPFVAAGPLLIALNGATAGAIVGGVAGAMIGMGIPEPDAIAYEERLRQGQILISVHAHADDDRRRAERILTRLGAHAVAAIAEPTTGDWSGDASL